MPTVKVVSFMHAVVCEEHEHVIIIKAARVNRFRVEMRKQNVDCELGMRDFRYLASRFPREVDFAPSQVTVHPSEEMKTVLRDISQSDIDRPRYQDIKRLWKMVEHEN